MRQVQLYMSRTCLTWRQCVSISPVDLCLFLRWSLFLCLDISVMGSGKELKRDTIVTIITPYKEGYKYKDIATCVGIVAGQVQKWIMKFRGRGSDTSPTPKPRSGRPRKITNRNSLSNYL